ncbi:MAG: hypothetical protein M3N52_10315 [Actinomycetota bacterium]|nr:hypothetical protein [Actinomycetota bacterium]
MRVPLSWLQEHVDPGLSAEQLAEVLTFGGFEVEAVLRPTAGVRGVKIAEVAAVERLEGSDRLWLVHVFDGQRTWEIVCGAANYQPGDKVPAALPGATLPGGATVGSKRLSAGSPTGCSQAPANCESATTTAASGSSTTTPPWAPSSPSGCGWTTRSWT